MKNLIALIAATTIATQTQAHINYDAVPVSFAPAIAQPQYPIDEARMLDYVNWIVDNSEFVYNGEALPAIERVSASVMQRFAYGEERYEEAAREGKRLPEVRALYSNTLKVIYVPDNVDLNDIATHHTIVHELVHYVQDINGRFEDPKVQKCMQRLEPKAYDLETRWLEETGAPGEKPSALLKVIIMMQCPDRYYGGR